MPTSVNATMERRWDVATTHTVLWPAAPLDPERLAAACAGVAGSVDRGSFIGRYLAERAAETGLPADEFLARHRDRFVGTAGCRSVDELLAAVPDRGRDGVPFSFLVCPGGFALSHSHALGDGSVSARLLEAVLRAYDGTVPGVPVPTRVAGDGDIARGLMWRWLRRPRGVLETATGVARRAWRRPPSTTVVQRRPVDRFRVAAVPVAEEDVAAIDRWRRARTPAPSMSVALLWIVSRALAAHGYPAGPQPWQVMASLRGAAEGLAGFGGNLVGRALVDVDPGGEPGAAGLAVRRQIGSGEIVALHLAKMSRALLAQGLSGLRRNRAGGSRPVRIGQSPGLSWSDRGRQAFGEGFADVVVRAVGGERPAVFTYVTPVQDGICVNVNWLGDRAGLLITFGASPLDDDAIDGVLAALGGDLGALLPDGVRTT